MVRVGVFAKLCQVWINAPLSIAFHSCRSSSASKPSCRPPRAAGAPVLSGQMILTLDARIVFQTDSLEPLLRIIAGESGNYTKRLPLRENLPVQILELHRRMVGAAGGTSYGKPFRRPGRDEWDRLRRLTNICLCFSSRGDDAEGPIPRLRNRHLSLE